MHGRETGPWWNPAFHRRLAVVLIILFCGGNLALTFILRPWQALAESSWLCGFESARIARNLLIGKGYGSPFVLFPEDGMPAPPPELLQAFTGAAASVYDSREFDALRGGHTPEIRRHSRAEDVPPTAWKTPPTVYWWLLCFRLGGLYTPTAWFVHIVLRILFTGLALWLFWSATRRACSTTSAALGLLLLVAYPPLWHATVADTHGTPLFLLLLMLSWYATVRLLPPESSRTWALVSAGAGAAAVMTLPPALPFYLFFWFHTAQRLRTPSGRPSPAPSSPASSTLPPAAYLGIVLAGCLLLWSPWIIRNIRVLDAPVIFSSNLAMELHYGNNAVAVHDQYVGHMLHHPLFNPALRSELLARGETAYARDSWTRFVSFIRQDFRSFMRLTAERVLFFWTWHRHKANRWRPLLGIAFLFYLCLTVICFVLIRRPAMAPPCSALVTGYSGFVVLFPVVYYITHFFDYRYRRPLEFVLVALSGLLLGHLLDNRPANMPSPRVDDPPPDLPA